MVSSQNGTHLRLISFKFGVKRKKKNMEATTYLFRFFVFIAQGLSPKSSHAAIDITTSTNRTGGKISSMGPLPPRGSPSTSLHARSLEEMAETLAMKLKNVSSKMLPVTVTHSFGRTTKNHSENVPNKKTYKTITPSNQSKIGI